VLSALSRAGAVGEEMTCTSPPDATARTEPPAAIKVGGPAAATASICGANVSALDAMAIARLAGKLRTTSDSKVGSKGCSILDGLIDH
jgi:hypothetical protein